MIGILEAWSNYITIRCAYENVASDLTDFPMPIYISESSGVDGQDLSMIFDELGANSKKLAITSSDGTTQLYVEVETWDHANKKALLHVKVPTWSSSEVTVLYLYYDSSRPDNTAYVGDVTDAVVHNVYDADFHAVYHLSEYAAGVTHDSTGNGYTGTGEGGLDDTNITDGPYGGKAMTFDGSDEYVDVNHPRLSDGTYTVEAIVKLASLGSSSTIYGEQNAGTFPIGLLYRSLAYAVFRFGFHVSGSTWAYANSTATIEADTWYYVSGKQGAEVVCRVDDNYEGTNAQVGGTAGTPTDNFIGRAAATNPDHFEGTIAEVRFSTTERSDAWMNATKHSYFDNVLTYDTCVYIEPYEVEQIRRLAGDKYAVTWSDAQMTSSIAVATRDISEKTFCCEDIDTISTASGTLEYDVPTDAIAIFACSYANTGIRRVNPAMIRHLPYYDSGSPKYYYHYNDKIGIYPVADDIYAVTVYFAKVTETMTDLPCYIRTLVMLYVLSKLRLSEGWQDDADMFNAMYLNSLNYYRDSFYAIPEIDERP